MGPVLVFVTALLGGPSGPALPAADAQGLGALVPRVKVGDQVRVEDTAGPMTTGRLTAIAPEGMTLETPAGEQHFKADAIAAVAVKRSYAGWAALVGFGAGCVIGYFTDPEFHDWDLPGLLGAAGGAIVGRFIPRMKTVYRAPGKVSLEPQLSRTGVALVAAVRW